MKTRIKTSRKIIDFVDKKRRVKTKEIVEYLGISPRAVYKQLKRLVQQSKIKKIGRPPEVIYIPAGTASIAKLIQDKPFKITKKQQIKELVRRVPPILNVDVVVYKDGKYLLGRRSKLKSPGYHGFWLFPGGRMRYDESPQEAAERILLNELPGVSATLRRLLTVINDKGADPRAYGVTITYLYEYESGTPKSNYQLDKFRWVTKEELVNDPKAYRETKYVMNEVDTAVRMLHSNQDELLVEVDKNDREIGKIIKRVAHSEPDRYHRAAHIVIFNSKKEVVLHQRSKNKDLAPGMWDIFGGHQVYGQTIDQTANSELAEELGVTADLKFVRKGLKRSDRQSEYFYLYYGFSDGPYGFDKNEVEQIRSFDCQKLIDREYDIEYDFIPHVSEYLNDLKDIWQ